MAKSEKIKNKIFRLSALGLLITQSCTNKNEKILGASDELHHIALYEQGNTFELLYNGANTVTGKYDLKGDTVWLTYTENQLERFNANEKLTRKIVIDKHSKRVRSIDDKVQFCANIYSDKRSINQPR